METQDKEITLPQWLKNLQENSWQMELFISGGAIFSLFQATDFLLDWTFTARMITQIAGIAFGITVGMLGIKLLTVGFFAHLMLRAYWISLVCLNDVFPAGSNLKRLKLAYPFSFKKPKAGNLVSQIIKLDQLAGLVFFLSIVSTLIILGSLLLVFVFLSIPSGLAENEAALFIYNYAPFVFFLLPVYYFDLMLFGLLRKIRWLSYLFFPFFWAFDRLTLRIFYEKSLQVYSSNIHRTKAALVFAGFFSISVALSYSAVRDHMGSSNFFDSRNYLFAMTDESLQVHQTYYLDELYRINRKASGPVIQSMNVKDNFLKIVIPYSANYDYYLSKTDSLKFVDFVGAVLDSDTINSITWHNFHAFEIDQVGLIGMLDIQDLNRGEHQLTIFKRELTKIIDDKQLERKITFWKE